MKRVEVYNNFKKDDVLVQDSSMNFYIYRLTMKKNSNWPFVLSAFILRNTGGKD